MSNTATDPAYGTSDPDATYNSGITAALNSNNQFNQIAGTLGGAAAAQAGLGQTEIGAAESQYALNNQQQQLSNQYNNALAGYQLGQLGISNSQLQLQGLGITQEQQLQATEQPIQTSELVGSEAASGALNTKGSIQNQQLLGAQQQYTNEQLQNAQTNLSYLAKANGMSQQEVYNQLAYMTASNNLQGAENPIALLNTIAQVNAGDITGIEGQLSNLGFASGLNLYPGQVTP